MSLSGRGFCTVERMVDVGYAFVARRERKTPIHCFKNDEIHWFLLLKYRFAYYGYKTISINDDNTVNIISSGGAYLRFNTDSGQDRFRYFKSSTYTEQKAISLYKYTNQ